VDFKMKYISLGFWLLITLNSVQAETFQEGIHYQEIELEDNLNVPKVMELFWYGCPHCYRMENSLKPWLNSKPIDFDFEKKPAVIRGSWLIHAKAFYTAKKLKVLNKLNAEIFNHIHKLKKSLNSKEAIQKLFSKNDIDENMFLKAFDSKEIQDLAMQAAIDTRQLSVTSTPTFIVKGRYLITAKMAGSQKKILDVIDYLLK